MKIVAAVLLGCAALVPSGPAQAAAPKRYVSCAALQHDYVHGVARPGGTDKVRGKTKPVTTFTVNQAAYTANKRLDADTDGVACERR